MGKCPCNCHDPEFRKIDGRPEHDDCGQCFVEWAYHDWIIEYEREQHDSALRACRWGCCDRNSP